MFDLSIYLSVWLVIYLYTPLKNMISSVGMMTFPAERKNKICSKPPTIYIYVCVCARVWIYH